ncbi:two-component sensor histidine kinase [Acrocarpospora phusangensis]|uniref:histidine kinase n=1 Tax=Acrocarpospora phusangensis TaxID=1070424 RepID=A0A919UMB0_9ACTN|nr:HAMP domain-containing sensor histidine kinase [Acrocarpospora phusangensis]GIH26794.1 two-component sensor histidine kinase [Acrocarpospora phusangensis]
MRTWHSWSVRARLTLIACAVMTLICSAVGVSALIGVRDLAYNYSTNRVVKAALKTVHLVKRDVVNGLVPSQGVAGVQIMRPDGTIAAASPNLVGRPPMAVFLPDDSIVRADRLICDSPVYPDTCMIIVAFRVYQPDGDWVIYAADEAVPWYVDYRLLAALIGGSLLVVGITGYGASWSIGRALAPVDAISEELAGITVSDLGHRVPVPKFRDEVRRMAEAANQTLDRLEEAVEQQRRFASDASHDLRSPLTAMRAEIEGALLHPEDADWPVIGEALLVSLDRLQALVTDLLQVARLDARAPGRTDPIDLGRLAATELDRRRRRVKLVKDLGEHVVVRGDRLRLARLITNLVDNAERHAASEVAVRVARNNDGAVLEVVDDGAGIAPDKREMVFQRFTRLDAARSRDSGGTGLGLAIARQIAETHGGTLTIEDSNRGARFVLRIPIAR